MKNMIDYMSTMIVTMVLIFVFSTIISAGLQMINARAIHSSAIEQIQSSFYGLTVDDLNKQIDDNWYFEIKELNSVNTRKDYEVILHYLVYLPLFSNSTLSGTIRGYAR